MRQLYPLVYHDNLVLSLHDCAQWIMLHFKEQCSLRSLNYLKPVSV